MRSSEIKTCLRSLGKSLILICLAHCHLHGEGRVAESWRTLALNKCMSTPQLSWWHYLGGGQLTAQPAFLEMLWRNENVAHQREDKTKWDMKEAALLNKKKKKGSIFASCKYLCIVWLDRAVTPDPLHCSSPQNHQSRVGTTSHHIKVPARSSWPFRSPYPGQILRSARDGRENQVQWSIKQRASSTHRKGKKRENIAGT